jgi:hypothetical protein
MKSTSVFFVLALWSSAAGVAVHYLNLRWGAAPPATAGALDIPLGLPVPAPFQGGSLAADSSGNVYIASASLNCVYRLDPSGTLTRVAGDSRAGYLGAGGPASEAQLFGPTSLPRQWPQSVGQGLWANRTAGSNATSSGASAARTLGLFALHAATCWRRICRCCLAASSFRSLSAWISC